MTRDEMETMDNDLCRAARSMEIAIGKLDAVFSLLESDVFGECEAAIREMIRSTQARMRVAAERMHDEAARLETELYGEGKDDERMAG